MSNYLFIFTISPVQSFISQARKLQDLYAGSQMLTKLSKTAATEFSNNNGKIIFPAFNFLNNTKDESYPNRFLGIVDTNNPNELGASIENKVQSEFVSIYNNIVQKYNIKSNNDALEQINKFLSLKWLFYPYDSDYTSSYNNIEEELGATKNLRTFSQLNEQGRKCSLCGERNVLFYYSNDKDFNPKSLFFPDNSVNIYDNIKNNVLFTQNEGLCAVCFTKRFYNHKKISFGSVSQIAMMDILPHIEKENSYLTLKNILNANFDEQLLYSENMTKDYFKKNFIPIDNFDEIKKNYNIVKSLIKEKNLKLKKYYALVMLDGDNMGKWLAGEYINNKNSLMDFHKNIAQKLNNYSNSVSDIIHNNNNGQVIYAGGDDVFALLNLSNLFGVLQQLKNNFPDFNGNEPSTASAGVVIAHYKTPLSEVINWAHKLEKEAKNSYSDKDAVSIAVLKHAGDIQKTTLKWNTLYIFPKIIDLLKTDDFSTAFISVLNEEFSTMNKDWLNKNRPLIHAELTRLIKRSANNTKASHQKLITECNNLFTNIKTFEEFIMALNIIDFIIRKVY